MTKRKKRPDLKGCPLCGNKDKINISGFLFCAKCNHRYDSSGLGHETERRDRNGDKYNASEAKFYRETGIVGSGMKRLPNQEEQEGRAPRPRNYGKWEPLK